MELIGSLFLLKLPDCIPVESQAGLFLTATALPVSLNQQINEGANVLKQIAIEVFLQTQSDFKLPKCFIFIDEYVFNKEMLSYDYYKLLSHVPFQVRSICTMRTICICLYRLRPARFWLFRADFITDYHYVPYLDMNKVKGTMRCHKNDVPLVLWRLWTPFYSQKFVFLKHLVDTVQWHHTAWLQTILNEYNIILQILKKRKLIYLSAISASAKVIVFFQPDDFCLSFFVW